MLQKLSKVLILSLILSTNLTAEPKHHWYKDKKNWFLIGVAVASDFYATHEIANCRARNDIQHCPDGGYGPFKGREGIRYGTSAGMVILSIWAREHWHGGWKTELLNDAPVMLYSGYNFRVGISDHNVPTYPKLDLNTVQVIKHR